jgi:flagellar capping protein FliD
MNVSAAAMDSCVLTKESFNSDNYYLASLRSLLHLVMSATKAASLASSVLASSTSPAKRAFETFYINVITLLTAALLAKSELERATKALMKEASAFFPNF